jgi:hypothetical protein
MPYIVYAPKPVVGGRGFRTSLDKLGEAASAETHAQFTTQSVTFSPDSEFHLASTGPGGCTRLSRPSPTLCRQFPKLESISDSSSESGAIHRRFACMGCAARCGEPTLFNDYQSAATHFSRSSLCNRSMRETKTVAVQLNTRPQHVGDVEAGGGGAAGSWRPQPAPSRRAGAMI